MFDKNILSDNKEENYKLMLEQYPYILSSSKDIIANLSNTAAVLNFYMNNINWAGFYINKSEKLILGPFQGFLACTEIAFNRGVCGACATTKQTQLVKNVHDFPGHIACDDITNSEIVIPIIVNDKLYGVLDVDSPLVNNFDEVDQRYLEALVKELEKFLEGNLK